MRDAVVIVGGSGKIGRALARALIGDGQEVIVLTRNLARARGRGAAGRLVSWSPGRIDDLAESLGDARAVVNLAGVPVGPWPWWIPGRRRRIVSSRIESTRAIVEAMRQLPVERRPAVLVNASGTDGFEGRDDTAATEETPFSGGFLAELCRAWEGEARQASALGVRVGIVRIGFVLACGAPALRLYALPFRLGLGGPLGDGRQWMSWIHIDDVVGILRLALEDDRVDGPINAVSPEPVRELELAGAIGTALGRRSWLGIPARLLRLAMGESAVLPLGTRRVRPACATRIGYRFRWPRLDAAVADALAVR